MRKIKGKKVPLSALDKFIYFACMLLSLAVTILVGWFFITLPINIGFLNDKTVAVDSNTIYWLPLITVLFALVIIPAIMFEAKQPIFGNKKFKPKWSDTIIKTYPLFSEDFKKHVWSQKRQKVKKAAIVLSIIIAASILISLFGVFPRTELDSDNRLYTYNSFNNVTHSVDAEDAEKLIIFIDRSGSRRGGTSYFVTLKFVFESKTYFVYANDFEEMSDEEALEYMIYLKSLVDGRYEVENTNKMERLLDDQNYAGREKELVYELFDYQ